MITAENAKVMLRKIGETFNFPTVNGQKLPNGDFHKIAFNVQKVNGQQLRVLTEMEYISGASVEMKRSGTGISIYFN